jgi:hypothetical protein
LVYIPDIDAIAPEPITAVADAPEPPGALVKDNIGAVV